MSRKRIRKPRKALGAGRTPAAAKPLTADELAFVYEYDTNGNNGTQAYRALHPHAKPTTAATEAWKTLRKPEIAAKLQELRRARWTRLQMDADEALAIVALTARADIRELFDKQGRLLTVHRWPDNIAVAVKGIRPGAFGTTVLLADKLSAARTILELAGELESPAEQLGSTLARILAGHYKAPGEKPEAP